MPKVELHNAYFFVCDECGKDSFGRLLPIGQDERDELADDFGIDAAAAGSWLMRPDVVRCQWCDATFTVED